MPWAQTLSLVNSKQTFKEKKKKNDSHLPPSLPENRSRTTLPNSFSEVCISPNSKTDKDIARKENYTP